MKLLCIAPKAVMHDWWNAEKPLVICGKEQIELYNCPDHDEFNAPRSEGAALPPGESAARDF